MPSKRDAGKLGHYLNLKLHLLRWTTSQAMACAPFSWACLQIALRGIRLRWRRRAGREGRDKDRGHGDQVSEGIGEEFAAACGG